MSGFPNGDIEEGPVPVTSTGVDEYQCHEPGCDFHIAAVGTPDPDEPDYYAEDIAAHKRGHESTVYIAEQVDRHGMKVTGALRRRYRTTTPDRAAGHAARTIMTAAEYTSAEVEHDDDVWTFIPTTGAPVRIRVTEPDADGALTGEPGVIVTTPPNPEQREALAATFAELANRHELQAPARPQALATSQAGLQTLLRSIPLDSPSRALAALQALGDVAITWQDADPDQPAGIEADAALSDAITTWRKSVGR